MSRPVHVEVQADDAERAKAFYGAAFGWDQDDSAMTGSTYWGITTGPKDQPGIDGGLLQRPAPVPADGQGTNAYVVTMRVDDDDAVERRILDAGGRVALPKFAMPGMAWQGYDLDPEGNTFGLHQADPSAA